MSVPTLTPDPAAPGFPEARPGSRAARLALPRSIDVLKNLPVEHVAPHRFGHRSDGAGRPAVWGDPRGQVRVVRQAREAAAAGPDPRRLAPPRRTPPRSAAGHRRTEGADTTAGALRVRPRRGDAGRPVGPGRRPG